jgi:hypothetical protein
MRHLPRPCVLLALLVAAGVASAQGVPATGAGGAARSGPALVAPGTATPQTNPTPANQTPQATAPLPGQSSMPQTLPPLNAGGIGSSNAAASGAAAPPGTLPTRSDTPLNAFRMLDTSNLGFVTRAETDRVPGFVGFDNADTNRDGRLTSEEFANAWKFYSGQ